VEIVGEVPRVGDPNHKLEPVEAEFAKKYLQTDMRWDGRHAWLRLRPEREYTWDFGKTATAQI